MTTTTLLLSGGLTDSRLFATAYDIRQAIPHAETAILDGQRHMAAAFDPDGFARTVLAFTAARN